MLVSELWDVKKELLEKLHVHALRELLLWISEAFEMDWNSNCICGERYEFQAVVITSKLIQEQRSKSTIRDLRSIGLPRPRLKHNVTCEPGI